MMYRKNYRSLVDQGRKAGLATSELYRALGAQRPEGTDAHGQQADGNGYVATYDCNGQRVFLPVGCSTQG